MIKIYKENIIEFLKDKKFIVMLILTSILAYGFTLTNFSVGVDDLSLDRYVNDTYILSQGRWGTFLIYNILGIREFTPFWLDFITLLLLISTVIFLCAFFKRISNSKFKKSSYIIFACGMISCPVIGHFFVYQPTKLTIVFSNLLISIAVALLYEDFIQNNKKLNIISILLILVSISMYESCAQTFLVLIFITSFIYFLANKECSFKELLKFYVKCFKVLIISMFLYFVTKILLLKILELLNLRKVNYANNNNLIKVLIEISDFELFLDVLSKKFISLFSHVVFKMFALIVALGLIVIITQSIKNKDKKILINYLLIIGLNLVLILYMYANLYRTCYSWAVTSGFILLYLNENFNKTNFKVMATIIIGYIILMQTKVINSNFYGEYLEYRRNALYLNNIASELLEKNINKPILFVYEGNEIKKDFELSEDNRDNYLEWGLRAFDGSNAEVVKFFAHLGYEVTVVEDKEEAFDIYENLSEEMKKEKIIDLEDFAIVKLEL